MQFKKHSKVREKISHFSASELTSRISQHPKLHKSIIIQKNMKIDTYP